jgi:hypothetical protein
MKRFLLWALIKVTLCTCIFAQTPEAAQANNLQDSAALAQNKVAAARAVNCSSMATPVCFYNFSSGSGDSALTYCVTVRWRWSQPAFTELRSIRFWTSPPKWRPTSI